MITALTKKCYLLAKKYHAGQFDKGGNPYINHPVAVAKKMDTEVETCAALLHDIIEDTDITEFDLIKLSIPKEVIDAVLILTHQPNERYVDYILRIANSNNQIAIKVKLADLEHNMDISRITNPTEKDIERINTKYKKSYNFLKNFIKNY